MSRLSELYVLYFHFFFKQNNFILFIHLENIPLEMARGRSRKRTNDGRSQPARIDQEIVEDRFDEEHRRKWTKGLRQPDAPTPATILKSG